MIKAELLVGNEVLLTVQLEYTLPAGVTKSDMVLKTVNNPYQIRLEGGDIRAVQDTGAFVSFLLAMIQKDPKCVSQRT